MLTTTAKPKKEKNGTASADTRLAVTKVVPISSVQTYKYQRRTEPKNWTPFNSGSAGIAVKRFSSNPLFISTATQLQNAAMSQPMKLLALLPTIHPSVGLALWNALRLTCPPEGIKLTAYKITPNGKKKADGKATQAVKSFFKQLPNEVGGLVGLQTTLTIQSLFTGMVCAECVPDDKLQGIRRVWPVDSLTVSLIRPNRDADLEPFQFQTYPSDGSKPTTVNGYSQLWGIDGFKDMIQFGLSMNYVHLNKNTFFWRSIDSNVDDLYGNAPYASCLNEVLSDLALMQDLRDAVHNAAWPRLEVGVDTSALHKVAVEVYKITNPTKAAAWVQARFDEIVDYVNNLYADDNIVHESSGQVKNIQPGSFQGLDGVLNFLRQRICQALKTLPTLLGINDGSTFNYTSVEWAIYAAGLETLRAIVAEIIVKIANLHLRLLGISAEVEATYVPIRTNDALVDANTKQVEIANEFSMFDRGLIDESELAMKLTGHEAADPKKLKIVLVPTVNTGKPGEKQAGQGGNNNKTGMTPEEKRNTNKKPTTPGGYNE